MHLVGFIIKKFVTMHGHMKVKLAKGSQARSVTDHSNFLSHVSNLETKSSSN